jgi:hypothetical protein
MRLKPTETELVGRAISASVASRRRQALHYSRPDSIPATAPKVGTNIGVREVA